MARTDSDTRTKTAARIAGPYLVIIGAALIARGPDMALIFPAFMQDGPLVLATGALTLIAGLTLVALHHHFTSAPAIAISLIGIVSALKGASLMIAPDIGVELTHLFVQQDAARTGAAVVTILLGLWLSFVGWFAGAKASS